jgi:hypothetical protein
MAVAYLAASSLCRAFVVCHNASSMMRSSGISLLTDFHPPSAPTTFETQVIATQDENALGSKLN